MTSWEYRKSRDEGEMEGLGREGWELVGVACELRGDTTFYFKRPAPDFRERVTLEQKRHYYSLMGVQSGDHREESRP